ncbi:hypothetical protein ENSA5_58200 [Enhygromyxa salina]|uniref:Uncharacterized protein n=1 Tax=Enhygromyxa salina TaxID=215803 RepID=A0A2S9XE00_9BACT|nr:hypothetical protein [Enhygromyxa salina]PRP91083.1 hypothetical protein ENSA5_58200 [Enhygromyxa salina]
MWVERRALAQVIRAHPDWTLEKQLVQLVRDFGKHAQLSSVDALRSLAAPIWARGDN